jgi:Metallo-peptidase family M12B Reprolysin-like
VANITLNVCLVGVENFDAADRQKINATLDVMKSIYQPVGITFTIGRFKISRVGLRGRQMSPINKSDIEAITKLAAGPNGTLDMFVVKLILGQHGHARINGPCDKRKKGMTGVVVALSSLNDVDHLGLVWAHEIGHYLGQDDCPCNDLPCFGNFMRGGQCSNKNDRVITARQADDMKRHCMVTP